MGLQLSPRWLLALVMRCGAGGNPSSEPPSDPGRLAWRGPRWSLEHELYRALQSQDGVVLLEHDAWCLADCWPVSAHRPRRVVQWSASFAVHGLARPSVMALDGSAEWASRRLRLFLRLWLGTPRRKASAALVVLGNTISFILLDWAFGRLSSMTIVDGLLYGIFMSAIWSYEDWRRPTEPEGKLPTVVVWVSMWCTVLLVHVVVSGRITI